MTFFLNSTSFNKVVTHFSEMRLSLLCLIAIAINLFVTILFQYLLFPDSNVNSYDINLFTFLSIIVIIPFVETLFFQGLIIGYFTKKYSKYELVLCLISSILFAVAHYYSPAYFLKTFISGFCYSFLYIIASRKMSFPFIPVLIAHSIFNLIGFFIQYFL